MATKEPEEMQFSRYDEPCREDYADCQCPKMQELGYSPPCGGCHEFVAVREWWYAKVDRLEPEDTGMGV